MLCSGYEYIILLSLVFSDFDINVMSLEGNERFK